MELFLGLLIFILIILALLSWIIWLITSAIRDERRNKRLVQDIKDQTRMNIYDSFIEGVGLVVFYGTHLSGGAFNPMNGNVQPVSAGTPDREELRNFKLTYSQITTVDILLEEDEEVLVINTTGVSYLCYLGNCKKCRDGIFERINR